MDIVTPSSESNATPESLLTWVDAYGNDLLRYALTRLDDRATAEDLVQETYLAAWRHRAEFRQEATTKTWLIAILRRKLVDHYRREARRARSGDAVPLVDPQPSDDPAETPRRSSAERPTARHIHEVFDRRGHWNVSLKAWAVEDPQDIERGEFWEIFRECLRKLPPRAAAAFMLRVMDEVETDEVCTQLKVTANNLGVLLYRGRLALRHCLGKNWFGEVSK